ncbi:MAG: TonB-dependent receptor, partial [Prevotella sp.]|nr:TonB-dependent receptor [Prevotella sp.]
WNRATSAVSGTQTLQQQSDLPSFDITNDLQLVRRIDSHLLTISSYNRYAHRPNSLTADSVLQDLTTDDFRSITEARYGWLLRRWSFYARGGIDLNLHRFQSSLSGLMLPDYPLEGRRNFTVLKTYASPEARYQHRRWWLTLSLPIGYYYYHVADRLADTSTRKHVMTISPMVYVRHQLTAKTDLSACLSYSLQPVAPSSYTQAVVMSDFRNLTFQTPSSEKIRQHSAFVRLRYRNPITSLFANLSAKYEHDYQPLMQNQLFIGDCILTEFVARGNNVSITQLNGGISKGLWSAKVTIGIDASLGHSSARMMRQNVEQPYTSTFIILAPKFTGKFTRWLSTDYSLTYTNNRYQVDAVSSHYSSLRQNLSITFLPTDQWHIALGAEHYYTRFSTDQTASITFLDASVRWLLSKRIDLALAATNLFDETDYRYTSFGSLSESFYSFNIRPRNIIIKMQIKI